MSKSISGIVFILAFVIILTSCSGVSIIEDISERITDAVTDEITVTSAAATAEEDNVDHSFDWQYDYEYDYSSVSVEGDYMFNDSGKSGCFQLLKRNVHTGECTTVCTDPFCKHNTAECPFYKTYLLVGIGNTMYGIMYVDSTGKTLLYSYNVDTGVKKTVYESSKPLSDLLQYKQYIYYSESTVGFFRLDTETGETVSVKSQSGYSLTSVSWGFLLWIKSDPNTLSYIATDLLGNDPRPYNPHIYKGKLHRVFKKEGSWGYTVAELNRNGEIEKVLIEEANGCFIIGDNMLYFGIYPDGPHQRDPNDPSKGTRYTNGDIYIAPIDTFESRLLCHVEEAELKYLGSSNLNLLLCGDWVAIVIPPNHPVEEDKIGLFNDMVIVNMKTGEYHISRYIE